MASNMSTSIPLYQRLFQILILAVFLSFVVLSLVLALLCLALAALWGQDSFAASSTPLEVEVRTGYDYDSGYEGSCERSSGCNCGEEIDIDSDFDTESDDEALPKRFATSRSRSRHPNFYGSELEGTPIQESRTKDAACDAMSESEVEASENQKKINRHARIDSDVEEEANAEDRTYNAASDNASQNDDEAFMMRNAVYCYRWNDPEHRRKVIEERCRAIGSTSDLAALIGVVPSADNRGRGLRYASQDAESAADTEFLEYCARTDTFNCYSEDYCVVCNIFHCHRTHDT
ncbi:hypothetical protein MMC11_003722 [Xylographa trunciseda]|nr:hypothetical protein [Xylographa trunciseda]